MATTTELHQLLDQARSKPGVAEIVRIYSASQEAMGRIPSSRRQAQVVYSIGANQAK